MAVSFADTVDLTCPICSATFQTNLWHVLDAAEHPDLWALCIKSTIHIVSCPKGHRIDADHFLLLHNAEQRRVIFSAANRTSEKEDEVTKQDSLAYLGRVHQHSTALDYLNEVIEVPRDLLPLALSGATDSDLKTINDILQKIEQSSLPQHQARRRRLCVQALKIVSRDSSPLQWARLQHETGDLLSSKATGNRARNVEAAIAAYNAALTVFTRENFPDDWATTQNNLGVAFADRLCGDAGENAELAVHAHEAALEVYTREYDPEEWARTQNNIGAALRSKLSGNHSDNVERALRATKAALTVFKHDTYPEQWALAQSNLSDIYVDRVRGNRVENLEKAIQTCQSVIETLDVESYPEEWALAQNNLGSALTERLIGNRATNLEEAIRAYDAALAVFGTTTFGGRVAWTQCNLGSAYYYRLLGDRTENIETSILLYQSALHPNLEKTLPELWARIQGGIGMGYSDRLRGSRAENLEIAIQAFNAALTIYSARENFPEDWADTQNNLGVVYSDRIGDDRAQNLERAIQAFEASLEVFTKRTFPDRWAMTQSNIATAYIDRVFGERRKNIEKAIKACKMALAVFSRNESPEMWAKTQNNLGNAYARRIVGDVRLNLECAVHAFDAALEIYRPNAFPHDARGTARNLASAYLSLKNWDGVLSALDISLQAAERLYASALTEDSKVAEIEENTEINNAMVEMCLRHSPPRIGEALQYAENGRSRLFRNQLSTLRLPPPLGVPVEMVEQETVLLRKLRDIENLIRTEGDGMKRLRWVDQQRDVHRQLDDLWTDLYHGYGAQEYVAMRRGENVDCGSITRWLQEQGESVALLEFLFIEDRLNAFILRSDSQGPVAVVLDVSPKEVSLSLNRLYREVHRYSADVQCEERWQGLAPSLLEPLMPLLEGVKLLYLVPHGDLHNLPLHALPYKKEPLISYFPIVYVPSAAVAMRMTNALHTPNPVKSEERFLVVGDPTGDLPFAALEVTKLAQMLGVLPLLRQHATKERVQTEMPGKTHIHIAAHAQFDPVDPFSSGIVLNNKELLTAREIMPQSLDAQLLVLSACQTGMQGIRTGDELIGFARALLYAGAASLVLSMWPVNDVSTADFMLRFYDHLFSNTLHRRMSMAEALRLAMLETREQHPHTHHWAAFGLFGAGR